MRSEDLNERFNHELSTYFRRWYMLRKFVKSILILDFHTKQKKNVHNKRGSGQESGFFIAVTPKQHKTPRPEKTTQVR